MVDSNTMSRKSTQRVDLEYNIKSPSEPMLEVTYLGTLGYNLMLL